MGKLLKLLHLHSDDTEIARRVSVCESVGDPERLRDTCAYNFGMYTLEGLICLSVYISLPILLPILYVS